MGQSQSTATPKDFKFAPPIQTREELLRRHRRRVSNDVLSLEQLHWFEAMFDIFSTQSESESTKFWSEKNLADFMQSIFPLELGSILMDAISIMHRCLLRLGSFPYQNNPEKFITHDVLRTAVVLITRSLGDADSGDFPRGERAIFFQSMASLDLGKVRDEKQRTEEDDSDLIWVLDDLQNRRRHPDNPKMMIRGPEHPSPSYFASSWSRDFDQSIPIEEFRSFIRLMVVLNLSSSGIDARNFATCLPQVEKVTDCILASFQGGPNGISWEVFDPVIGNDIPCLLLGWSRLLGPLALIRPLPQGSFPSSMAEGQKFLQKAYIPTAQRQVPSSGYIFNLPILSQLGFYFPRYVFLEGASTTWSSKGDQLNLSCLRDQITQISPMILLVSGINQGQQHVVFGLFDPKGSPEDEEKARIFQLEPVHRTFKVAAREKENCSIQVILEGENPTLMGQITWHRGYTSPS